MAPKKKERKEAGGGDARGGGRPSSPRSVKQKRSRHLDPVVDENHRPRYELNFTNGLATEIFSMKFIRDRNDEPLKIRMKATHQEEIDSQIPSAKIRVVVLDGDFNEHNQKCWTREQFEKSIARPRPNCATLLAGDHEISLANGEAYLRDLKFRDISRFTRSGKFRLGVMVVDNLGERVLEGITEPFIVKHGRGEASAKFNVPKLEDGVWRLKQVAKDHPLHLALNGSGIFLVKDFLSLYHKDEQALRKIFIDVNKNSVWTASVEHAKKCLPGTELYSFVVEGQSVMLFFNSVCQIVGAKFGDNYTSIGDLEKHKKDMVVKWSKVAYKNMTYDQHDYEMDNGKPRPINQDMLPGPSKHEGTDTMQGHSAETNGNVCLPDNQLVTSGGPSNKHEPLRLDYVGVTQIEEQQHPDEEQLEEQQHLDELEEAAALQQEQQDQDDPEQEQQDQDSLVQEVARLQAENARVAARAADIATQYARVEQENTVLRARAAELGDRLRTLNEVNEVFRIVEESSGVAMDIQEGMPVDDPLLRPWQLPCPAAAMPIGATEAHMFQY